MLRVIAGMKILFPRHEPAFCYQWFDEHIDLTEELVEAFYEESKGIIDQAVSLYIAVQGRISQIQSKINQS